MNMGKEKVTKAPEKVKFDIADLIERGFHNTANAQIEISEKNTIGNWAAFRDICPDNKSGVYMIIQYKVPAHEPVFNGAIVKSEEELGGLIPYKLQKLHKKWKKSGQSNVLYIGQADIREGHTDTPERRLNSFFNKAVSHANSRAIFQIPDYEKLVVVWKECNDPEALVTSLRAEFKKIYGSLPFANWRD